MSPRLFALLVGIDAYPAPLPPLAGCVNDIEAVHAGLLARLVGPGPATAPTAPPDAGPDAGASTAALPTPTLEALVLPNEKATHDGVVGAFGTHLGRAGPGDVALFYFSGHGSQQRISATQATVEADRRNETIVLHDSRQPGHSDLNDKELAVLISRVAVHAGHVLVVLDCCHSGDGTRDLEPGTRVRVAPEDDRERAPDLLLARADPTEPGMPSSPTGPESLVDQPASPHRRDPWSSRAGEHVLIAACRSSETAKETTVDGISRGVLSAALEGTLRDSNGTPTYRDVLRLVTSRILLRVPDQHPQVEAVRAVDLDRPFLGGAIPATPRRLTLSELPDGWSLDAGAIHGIPAPIGDDSTELAIYPLTGATTGSPLAVATVARVLPDRSLVALSRPLASGFVYHAVVTGIPLSPIGVAVVGQAAHTAALREAASTADATLITLVDPDHDPVLVVRATADGFVITRPGVTRPLVPIFSGADRAERTLAALEHVSRWLRLSTLSNPTTGIPAGAVRIDASSAAGHLDPSGRLRITYAAELAPTFTVALANTTAQLLWCALLDLTETYGVFTDAFPSGSIALGPGESTVVTLTGFLSDELWRAGTIELTDQLRIVVSTVEFDPRSLEQAELEVSTVSPVVLRSDRQPASSLDRVLTRVTHRAPVGPTPIPTADWRTEDLYVVTTRPRQ